MSVFNRLIGEGLDKKMGNNNPYNYSNNFVDGNGNGKIDQLADISALEGQCQFIKDFALGYFNEKDIGKLFQFATIDAANVLSNSGFESQAIDEVLGVNR